MPALDFLIPGDLQTATGGYAYDRRIIAGLRALGWEVRVRALDPGFPQPDATALTHADRTLYALPHDALCLIDGLAFGAIPHIAQRHAQRLRLVALVHHPLHVEAGLSPEDASALERAEKVALAAARHVIVTSEETRVALSALDVDPTRVSVVEPGTDRATHSGRAARAPRGAHAEAHIGAPSTRLLCVATLTPRKGHAVLLQALAALKAQPWHLVCVGSLTRHAATAQGIEAQIQRLGLGDRVTLLGEVSAERLSDELADADLFVLPTLHEGYGMVVAEALAHGLPVIATRTGAIPRLLAQGGGVVVPPGDAEALKGALKDVLTSPSRLAALTLDAQARRESLIPWDVACAQMAEILKRVAAR